MRGGEHLKDYKNYEDGQLSKLSLFSCDHV